MHVWTCTVYLRRTSAQSLDVDISCTEVHAVCVLMFDLMIELLYLLHSAQLQRTPNQAGVISINH